MAVVSTVASRTADCERCVTASWFVARTPVLYSDSHSDLCQSLSAPLRARALLYGSHNEYFNLVDCLSVFFWSCEFSTEIPGDFRRRSFDEVCARKFQRNLDIKLVFQMLLVTITKLIRIDVSIKIFKTKPRYELQI